MIQINIKTNINFILLLSLIIAFLAVCKPIHAATFRRALLDVNRDSTISGLDMQKIRQVLGTIYPTGIQALADVNQDGIVNDLDRKLVGAHTGTIISVCEAADISNNGKVGQEDADIVSLYFAQEDNSTNMMADITGDGWIDILDLSIVGSHWGCVWSGLRPPPANPFY